MLNLIIVLAVILIVAILIAIFKVTTLVGIAKGDAKKPEPSNNKLNATLLALFLVAGLFGFFYYSFGGLDEDFVQPIASEHGLITERLFWITMGITGFVFVITQIFLFGFSYKYQYKKDGKATFYAHNNKLEVIWTAVPAVVLAVLIVSGWKAWVGITSPAPEGAEVVEVMGYQYAWAVRYPGDDKKLGDSDYKKIDVTNQMGIDFSDKASFDDFIPLELHIPKGKPVLLKIRARDVIHSVYMPHFRMQMNAVPGMPTHFWFTPTKSTADMRAETGNPDFNYELVCNKICGKGHFAMRYVVVVDEPADYEKWYSEQTPWLKQNEDYLSQVPAELKEMAKIAAGIEAEEAEIVNIDNALVSTN
ncbi:cytochrome c oxidase subunit II [Marinoscillum sp. MHG1-6]|uniref:cytochrome c oxidase subunit II n=1 Tax=Marinoscillum sp. MHG1-6 TaxID=2959627 RepID=UPI0021570838|nr:cytochrome c oxidase subunit II [Marinoscillum sp. MHG1-6]